MLVEALNEMINSAKLPTQAWRSRRVQRAGPAL